MFLNGITYTMFKYDTVVEKMTAKEFFSKGNEKITGKEHCVIKLKENDTTGKRPLMAYIGISIVHYEKCFTCIFDKLDSDDIGYSFYRNEFGYICNYGLALDQMIHHIKVRCEELNKPGILDSIVGLYDKSTEASIQAVQEHLDHTIAQGEEKDILTEKDFICSPILVNEHWTVAVISKGEINIFDPTLQTKEALDANGQLQIGDCKQKVHYLNEKPIQDEKGTICGLCSAEFIIEAAQCESLGHLKQNINTICNKIATNVIKL